MVKKMETNKIYEMDCIKGMNEIINPNSIDIIITSPPYNIGIKYNSHKDNMNFEDYSKWMNNFGKACKRVLKENGSLFFNIGDKASDELKAFEVAKQLSEHLTLQNTIHWIKSIAIDEVCSVGHYKPINSKRYINDCHEYIYHFTKTGNVELDRLSIGVPYKDKSNAARWGGGDVRCRGNVWFIPYETVQTKKKHPAMFPPKLPEMCMKLHGLARIETVLDPFSGAGNTALACIALEKDFVGFEIDKSYCDMTIEAIEAIY